MTTLFRNGIRPEVRTVVEWGRLVAMSDASIGLPAFQRSTVWDEQRVELLWDSVTRGFPIGALLFTRPTDQESSESMVAWKPISTAPMSTTTRLASQPAPLLVIDGQQRLTSLQLGFRPFENGYASRLWIDLAPPVSVEAHKRGRFRLCSRIHPWGWGASVSRRRESRKRIMGATDMDDADIPLCDTWPVDARVPVDAAALIGRVLEGGSNELPTWVDLLPGHFPPVSESLKQEVYSGDGLPRLVAGLHQLDRVHVVGLLIECIADLGEIFARLNSQGMPMSQEELFFSALKARWPGCSDLVADIVEDPAAGKLLPATKIVHLATRIVVSESEGTLRDVDNLTLDRFAELENRPGLDLVPQLKRLLAGNIPSGGKGRLHASFTHARSILQYRETPDRGDPGLPVTLLGHLHWRSWHAVAAWAEKHCHSAEDQEDPSRIEALRLVVLLHFFVKTDVASISRVAFEIVRAQSARSFPGALIAATLLHKGLIHLEPPEPQQFRELLANAGDEGKGRATWPLLAHEQHLIHWAQRHWIHAWYPRHDPTLYQSVDDLPYDIDHIMPDHAFDGRGRRIPSEVFKRDAAALRGSVGNLRIWPRDANRSDKADTPEKKLYLGRDAETQLCDGSLLGRRPFAFRDIGEVRDASLIGEDQRAQWLKASQANHLKDWSDPERALALRRAIDDRRAWLYTSLWRGLGYGLWWNEVRARKEMMPSEE
jgi:hypothetical protein